MILGIVAGRGIWNIHIWTWKEHHSHHPRHRSGQVILLNGCGQTGRSPDSRHFDDSWVSFVLQRGPECNRISAQTLLPASCGLVTQHLGAVGEGEKQSRTDPSEQLKKPTCVCWWSVKVIATALGPAKTVNRPFEDIYLNQELTVSYFNIRKRSLD